MIIRNPHVAVCASRCGFLTEKDVSVNKKEGSMHILYKN
jgi:hypothetical protein